MGGADLSRPGPQRHHPHRCRHLPGDAWSFAGGTNYNDASGTVNDIIDELPDIQMNDAAFNGDTSRVIYHYSIVNEPGPFTVEVYRSADATFDSTDILLGQQVVSTSPTSPQAAGVFRFSAPLIGDPSRPYLLVVADPANAIKESNESNNVASLVLPTVTVTLATPRRFTLMQDVAFQVDVTPASTVSASTIETRRSTVATWTTVATAQSATLTQRLAGYFRVRGSATVDSIQFFSQELDFEVQFPTVGTVAGDGTVSTAMATAWTDTLTFAQNNSGAQAADGSYPSSLRHRTRLLRPPGHVDGQLFGDGDRRRTRRRAWGHRNGRLGGPAGRCHRRRWEFRDLHGRRLPHPYARSLSRAGGDTGSRPNGGKRHYRQ